MMETPNIHDGYFDGFLLGPNKVLYFFLRTTDGKPLNLIFHGMERMCVSGVKEGNIILDLQFRDTQEITLSDVEELYVINPGAEIGATLLSSIRQRGLKLMELNPSYGAQALVLFECCDLSESAIAQMPSSRAGL
jgi:hypothetical protein